MHIEKNLADWERLLSVTAGAALVVNGIRRRGVLGALTGASLIARGASGYCPISHATGFTSLRDDTRSALGGSRGTKLKESVTIAKTPAEVFDFWNSVGNLPLFIRGLERVEVTGPSMTRWTMQGPGGVPLQWDAETINEIAPELIAWRSLPGSDVVSAGSVHFKSARRGGTEVTVSMQYSPPYGTLGTAIGWIAGRAPSSELREDLRRLKRLLETGEQATADGQSAGTRSRFFTAAQQVMA